MALQAVSYQFLSQQGLTRLVDPSGSPDGPHNTVSYWLVPSNGYINGQRLPHDVNEDLNGQKYDKQTIEGVDYFLVPEVASNVPGRLSHYAQLTGVAELQNPPGGGVNRVRETLENTSQATVAPDAVSKYVDEHDSFEDARKKRSEEDERIDRAVTVSPGREPAEGKLVEVNSGDSSEKKEEVKSQKPSNVPGK